LPAQDNGYSEEVDLFVYISINKNHHNFYFVGLLGN